MNSNNTYIRVGEKNNFNFLPNELNELKAYQDKGNIFVNSNSFTKIKNDYPSIVTINPYLNFQPLPKNSDTSNIKAFRIKWIESTSYNIMHHLTIALKYADELGIPVLLTFFRARSKDTVKKYSMISDSYTYKGNYYRINKDVKQSVIRTLQSIYSKIYVCDESELGCPSCNNCTKLTYKNVGTIKALNLSISGQDDKRGKQGICPFKCPDCFAKIVTYGYSPSCDKLITNNKLKGNIKKRK